MVMKRTFTAKSLKLAKIRVADKYYPGSITVRTLKKPTRNKLGKFQVTYKERKGR